MALGLIPPWFVDRSEFDAKEKRLDLYIDFLRGAKLYYVYSTKSQIRSVL